MHRDVRACVFGSEVLCKESRHPFCSKPLLNNASTKPQTPKFNTCRVLMLHEPSPKPPRTPNSYPLEKLASKRNPGRIILQLDDSAGRHVLAVEGVGALV